VWVDHGLQAQSACCWDLWLPAAGEVLAVTNNWALWHANVGHQADVAIKHLKLWQQQRLQPRQGRLCQFSLAGLIQWNDGVHGLMDRWQDKVDTMA